MRISPTTTRSRPRNDHILLDNECYPKTGAQPVRNAKNVAYYKLVLASGYQHAHGGDFAREFYRQARSREQVIQNLRAGLGSAR